MNISKGFYDLCVPYNKDHKKLSEILAELHQLGYRTVAIEQIFDHRKLVKIPDPENIDDLKLEWQGKLQILQRLTIIYENQNIVHLMNNCKNLKKYHLIAGVPKTESSMQHCCSIFNGDIIGMDLEDSKNIFINHKHYQLAIRRGMFFEIPYAAAITDSTKRKDIMIMAYGYASQRRSKNIIISSGGTSKFHIRGPYDIANLGLIFGLSEEQSKSAISFTCRKLLLKANARRFGKTAMFVRNTSTVEMSSTDDSENDDNSENSNNSICEVDDSTSSDDELSESEVKPIAKKKKMI